jgi:predicted dehydrogenase
LGIEPHSAKLKDMITRGMPFCIAAVGLEHPHVYGQCDRFVTAGAVLKWVFDNDKGKVNAFCQRYPMVQKARCLEQILDDSDIKLVVSAAIPSERCKLGCHVMEGGKDFFTAKPAFVSLAQGQRAREAIAKTGKKYMVYYNERLGSEAAVFAGDLVGRGTIGKVVQVLGLGPHRQKPPARPSWFYEKSQSGGILTDLGSHQIEQFLFFAGARTAAVVAARTANFNNEEFSGFEDFGEASLIADNGVSGYFRVDWLTPRGLGAWGDARTIILGTTGYIEMRKSIDIARASGGEHVYLVNDSGESYYDASGKTGLPFFKAFIQDCLSRTEHAMTQEHALRAAELAICAQKKAILKQRTAKAEIPVCLNGN